MLLSVLIGKVRAKTLTCGDVVSELMRQPTQAIGRKIESHVHMHAMEGFKLSQTKFSGTADQLLAKKGQWEQPTHLFPSNPVNDVGRRVYTGVPPTPHLSNDVLQDGDRLPLLNDFAYRTGLGELPLIETSTSTVRKRVKGGPPLSETYETITQSAAGYQATKGGITKTLIVGIGPDEYFCVPGKPTELGIRVDKTIVAARVAKSPVHTMFPDSESLVLHLTAALGSDAGLVVLEALEALGTGAVDTVGLFSKTAVRSVTDYDPKIPNVMLERSVEVDQTQPRLVTGFYPMTGNVNVSSCAIDHVVVVMGYSACGRLTLKTCYPSKETTLDSIGKDSAPLEDLAETVYSKTFVKVIQASAVTLKW